MRKDTQTHTHLTRARDRDAETPYKNSSTDLASDTRDLYVLIVAITYIPLSLASTMKMPTRQRAIMRSSLHCPSTTRK